MTTDAREDGARHCREGGAPWDNPHAYGTAEAEAWRRGFHHEFVAHLRSLGWTVTERAASVASEPSLDTPEGDPT